MPYSDEEYDSQGGFTPEPNHPQNLSKAELRKTNKPIMEKKRRARINNCLNELKDLLLDAMKKDPARHSKLEKADILELTVKHLQAIQRQQLAAAVAADPAVLHRFRSGFGDCATEVRRYLNRLSGMPPGLKGRLGSHLNTCLSGIERLNPLNHPDYPTFPGYGFEFDDNSRRPSAFQYVGKPHSPPLSPISCDSACDSSTEPETPPRPSGTVPSKNVTTFPTPPSRSASDQDSSPETQKPTVSSTTISPETKLQQGTLDLKSKKYAEPLSIVIDVENYKIEIDASPKRPIDYRHKLKRHADAISKVPDELRPSAKVPRFETPAEIYRPLDITQYAARLDVTPNVSKPEVKPKTVISHTAESLAASALSTKTSPEAKMEADTSSRSPEQKPQCSGDAMWRPW